MLLLGARVAENLAIGQSVPDPSYRLDVGASRGRAAVRSHPGRLVLRLPTSHRRARARPPRLDLRLRKLPPQIAHVDSNDTWVGELVPPYLFQQLFPAPDPARALHEVSEEFELGLRQVEGLILQPRAPARQVKRYPPGDKQIRILRR